MDKIRYLTEKIENLLTLFPCVAVIGTRQCGKSTLVKKLGSHWQYYDLENPSDYQLITSDPLSFFEINDKNVIIDEAQQYPDLFQVLRGVIDSNRELKGRFILTGSSSPEIVKGLTESLAGRIATVEMGPFKQGEFYDQPLPSLYEALNSNGGVDALLNMKTTLTLKQCMNVWYKGGFPEPLIESEASPNYLNQWAENYIANYVNRDIRGLFTKLNIHNFRRFLTLLSQFSGHQLNMSKMARALSVSVSTVKDYLDIIHQTFLWRNLPPFEKNTLKKIQKANKGFFRDQGLLHFFLKINSVDDLLLHPVAGYSFESFVIEELIRGFQSTMATQLEFSYYRTIDKSEVDFIIDSAFGVIPVEIKLSSVIKSRALIGMKTFISDMNCSYGIIINRGAKIQMLTKNIIQIPVQYI